MWIVFGGFHFHCSECVESFPVVLEAGGIHKRFCCFISNMHIGDSKGKLLWNAIITWDNIIFRVIHIWYLSYIIDSLRSLFCRTNFTWFIFCEYANLLWDISRSIFGLSHNAAKHKLKYWLLTLKWLIMSKICLEKIFKK